MHPMQRGAVALLVDPITVFFCQLVVMHQLQVYPVRYNNTLDVCLVRYNIALIQGLQRNASTLHADNKLH